MMMIVDFESRILGFIDDMVEHASDDELFAGGYLRGHITLAVSALEADGVTHQENLYQQVTESLDAAIRGGELSPRDQVLVTGMWDTLYTRASQPQS